MNIRHIVFAVVIVAAVLLVGEAVSSKSFAQTCTPPPSGNISIQTSGGTNSYGASGRTLAATDGVAFSATIQTLGITGPLDISIAGLPAGITQKANPLQPLGGSTFSGMPIQAGTYSVGITLENGCGTGSYTVPLVVRAAGSGTSFSSGLSGRPSCTLTASPQVVQPGQTTLLSWTVQGNATESRFTPALPGSPDGARDGSTQTGPINQETRFMLQVWNEQADTLGGGACERTVMLPTQSGSYDVTLVSKDDVYNWHDIPAATGRNSFNTFQNIEWIPSGHFVVTGICNTAFSYSGGPSNVGRYEDSGMYVFAENGSFIGKRDICYDSSIRSVACAEGGGCFVGHNVIPIGGAQFLASLHPIGPGFPRSPTVYGVGSSGVSLLKQIFFNTLLGRWYDSQPPNSLVQVERVAVANNIMAGVETTYARTENIGGHNRIRNNIENVFYSLPGLSRLAAVSGPTVTCPIGSRGCSPSYDLSSPLYYPIVGVGNYFVASSNMHLQPPFEVYRMPGESEILGGARPEKVQTLTFPGWIADYAIDVQDRSRVAFSFTNSPVIQIYRAGSSGLTLEKEITTSGRPQSFGVPRGLGHTVALSGEYLVYPACASGFLGRCDLVVERNGQKLSVEPLPREIAQNRGGINTLSVSPSGQILVGTLEIKDYSPWGDKGTLYLYQIGGAGGTPPPVPGPGPEPTPVPIPGGEVDISTYYNFARQYIEILKSFFNSR